MEVSGQLHAPAALPPGKQLAVPIGQEAGLGPEPVGKLLGREQSGVGAAAALWEVGRVVHCITKVVL
jgi:hypothetical protein